MANSQEHTVKAFDQDIGQLRGLISQMGGLAERAIAQSMVALQRGDTDFANDIRLDDKKIDVLETEVERTAVRIIALRAPMADDLREIMCYSLQRRGFATLAAADPHEAVALGRDHEGPIDVLVTELDPRDARLDPYRDGVDVR